MQIVEVERDVLTFRGDAYESVATAFVRGDEVLLVDALASSADAATLREHLESVLGKTVRVIVVTHYMSDHVAGLRFFPEAEILAHRYFMHTFLSQRGRSAEDDEAFVRPTILVDGSLALEWGRHSLELFHNPGKTLCTLCIDVPGCDLLFASDNLVGNIVYLSSAAPEMLDCALERLERRRRGRVIGGHIGVLDGTAVRNARFYLARLRERVQQVRDSGSAPHAVKQIKVQDCLAPGVEPIPFEREWHDRNLDVVVERRLFSLDAQGFTSAASGGRRSEAWPNA
jgi:glyoxylase-like metal-dependent hydrolase (beta-lactamase superfamily II)